MTSLHSGGCEIRAPADHVLGWTSGSSARARPGRSRRSLSASTWQSASTTILELILETAGLAVSEADGNLAHPRARLNGAVGHLDLEAEAGRLELDRPSPSSTWRRKHLKPPVRSLTGHPENRPRVPGAAAAEEPAAESPVDDPAAGHVPRPEHQVGVAGGGDQGGNALRVVGEVGIHLHHQLGSFGERPLEAGHVGPAEAVLLGAVEHLHRAELGGQAIRDLAGAVRRGVVDDEDVVLARRRSELRQDLAHERLEVLGLVVGRENQPGVGPAARRRRSRPPRRPAPDRRRTRPCSPGS